MKEKIKRFAKQYLIGFVIGIVVCGGVSVIAATYFPSNEVTYDNGTSGMQATDVQGAIDELYNICNPPYTPGQGTDVIDQILDKNQDELYEDEYEEGKYTYKGSNPNNYITFNNEKAGWRIISIEGDGKVKIAKTDSVGGNMAWNTVNSSNWSTASLNTYLNETYYNTLTSEARSQIYTHDFNVGAVTTNNNNLQDQINDENSCKWNGKIALPTISEVIRSNSNTSTCGTIASHNSNMSTCYSTMWLGKWSGSNDSWWWTLSTMAGSPSTQIFHLGNFGAITNISYDNQYQMSTHPTLYLSSDIQITGGDGSQSNPYTLG